VKYLTEILFVAVIGVSAVKVVVGFNEPYWGTYILLIVLAVDALNWARFKRHLRSESPEAAKTIMRILK